MKLLKVSFSVAAFVACLLILGVVIADDDGKSTPKYTIKEVMKIAHKDGLLKKVIAGDASQEEKLSLLDYYISLVENEPPKGDMESWHNLAGKAALAAAKVAVGRDDATAELKTAANCGKCHKAHKGK